MKITSYSIVGEGLQVQYQKLYSLDGSNDVKETSGDEDLNSGVAVGDRPDVNCASAHEGTRTFSARGSRCIVTTPGFRFVGGGDGDRLGGTDPLDGGEFEGVRVGRNNDPESTGKIVQS